MKCDKCGAELKDDALFCSVCGANTVLAQLAAKKAADPGTGNAVPKKPVPRVPAKPPVGTPANSAVDPAKPSGNAPAAQPKAQAVDTAKQPGNAPAAQPRAQAVNTAKQPGNAPAAQSKPQAVDTAKQPGTAPAAQSKAQAVDSVKQPGNAPAAQPKAQAVNTAAPTAGNASSAPANPVKSRPKRKSAAPGDPAPAAAQKPVGSAAQPSQPEPQEPVPTIIFTGHPSDLIIPRQAAPEEPEENSADPMNFEEDSMPEVGKDVPQPAYSRVRLSPGIDDAAVTGKSAADPVKGLSADLTTQTVKPIRVINWTPLKIVLRILAIILAVAVAAGVVMYFTGMLYKFGVVEKIYDMTGVCIQHHYDLLDDEPQSCTICGRVAPAGNTGSGTPDSEPGAPAGNTGN